MNFWLTLGAGEASIEKTGETERQDERIMTMRHKDQPSFDIRRILAGALLIVVASVGDAFAQNVVVFVNGEPITAIDIEQRSKFLQVTSQKAPPRQEVLDQLIDEKLKVREAKRWGMDISDSEVNSSFATMASRMNMSSAQLTQQLAKSGVNDSTLKAKNQGGHCMAAAGSRPLSVATAHVRPGGAVDSGIEERRRPRNGRL